jgi:hypothetical protein
MFLGETKKERKLMQKINKKSGLALGSIFALLASTFVGVAPASANETAAVIAPTGSGALTQNTMLITETFETVVRYGTGVVGALTGASSGSGTVANAQIQVSVNSSSAALTLLDLKVDGDGNFAAGAADLTLTSVSSTVASVGYNAVPSTSAYVSIGLDGRSSISAALDVTVTPFLELDGSAGLTSGDAAGTPYVISFVPWSALGAAVSLTAPLAGDRGATASVTVTAGNIRWSQLDGKFGVAIKSTGDTSTGTAGTISANVDGSPTARTGAEMVTANYSFSAAVNTAPFTTSGAVQSASAQLFYFAAGTVNATDNPAEGRGLTVKTTKAVSSLGVAGTTVSPVAGDNIVRSGANAADARFNSAFSLTAFPYSASITTSVAIDSAFTVSAVGAGIEFDADSGVIVDGTTYTSSAAFLAAGFTLKAGTTAVAVSTFGQSYTGATDQMTFELSSQLKSTTLVITLQRASYTVDYDLATVAGLAGVAKTFALEVEDQWGVKPARTDLRVAASVKLGASTSETVSAAVAAGKASVTVTPTPATRTGSATVTFTLQTLNQETANWENTATDTATWNVYSYVAGTDAFTSRTVSISASISYGVALSYSTAVVAVGVVNSYSDVVASAPGLIIQNADATSATASDKLTVAANGKTANFKFTARKAGSYTVTFTNGTATTTSTVVVDVAAGTAGKTITFDKTSLVSGETAKITGTVADENGNPVTTTGSADVVVSWAGLGLPFNTGTLETDADGKFSINVLVLATEVGTGTITATYRPTGDSTSTKNVTVASALAIGTPAAEVNAVIGSFNGRWAVRVENAKGSAVTIKVGGNWYKVNATSDSFVFSRKSKVGATPLVKVWVDGALQNEQTVTVK